MTSITDLGRIDAPMLLTGGAYSNLEAFEAMLDEARRRGVAPGRIIHSGDVVAYCADPAATARALERSGAHAIRGNVEIQLAEDADDCGCGFAEGSTCSALSAAWYGHARRALAGDADLLEWMGALPDRLAFTMNGVRAHVVHGGASAVNRHMFASMPDHAFEGEIALIGNIDLVIAGHCGLPFSRPVGRYLWHNTGALGMPANDGTPRVWVSLVAPDGDGIRIDHVALDYDHRTAAAKMRRDGLPEGYAAAIESGLWPSLDTLPEAERRRTGRPISPASHRLAPRPARRRSSEPAVSS